MPQSVRISGYSEGVNILPREARYCYRTSSVHPWRRCTVVVYVGLNVRVTGSIGVSRPTRIITIGSQILRRIRPGTVSTENLHGCCKVAQLNTQIFKGSAATDLRLRQILLQPFAVPCECKSKRIINQQLSCLCPISRLFYCEHIE